MCFAVHQWSTVARTQYAYKCPNMGYIDVFVFVCCSFHKYATVDQNGQCGRIFSTFIYSIGGMAAWPKTSHIMYHKVALQHDNIAVYSF